VAQAKPGPAWLERVTVALPRAAKLAAVMAPVEAELLTMAVLRPTAEPRLVPRAARQPASPVVRPAGWALEVPRP
jgi:hypothetical protein